MDTFTFLIAILLIMLAMQFQYDWIVFAVVAIMIFTLRSVSTTIILLIAVFVMYFVVGTENISAYWPIIVVGLILLSLAFGIGGKPQQPEYYSPGGYGDLLGGAGGEMGAGGY